MPEKSTAYQLLCIMCGSKNDERKTSTYCTECGGVLSVRYQSIGNSIQYPLAETPPDPLKYGPTNLKYLNRLSKRYGAEIWAKLELQNPTGCFKDRGSYVEVLKALELNADAICLASTGNMAASVAAYACYYDIPCFVFVPENTSEAKLAQATIHNANAIRIKGDFSTCEALCREFAKSGNYYLAGDYVFREEGQKSFSYELIEQGGHDFDYIFVPVGCGTNFSAIWKGLKEAKAGGLISELPVMVAVQPDGNSPVVQGIFKREKVINKKAATMAQAVATGDPVDFYKVLAIMDECDGLAYTTSEEEILDSLKEMTTTEGIFTEPSCALPLAALKKNTDTFRDKKCLLVLTGTGLKDTGVISKHSISSPVLEADLKQVNDYINSGYIEMQREAFGKSRDNFTANLKLEPEQSQIYQQYLERINKKGKTLTGKEIEVLQSLVFNEISDLNYPATLVDYNVVMKKDELVTASVSMEINGTVKTAEGKGVGPVDALLHTCKILTDRILPLDLQNHAIEILIPGTNSLVVVTLTLNSHDTEYVTKAASPDTLEAALQAFMKGLAIAWRKEHSQD